MHEAGEEDGVMETEVKTFTAKVNDQENRSHSSNIRLVNLPEGAEGKDPCTFMER